jgi:broad specificity phosphatase PhoE
MAEGNGRFQGQRDVPLVREGRRQLNDLVRRLACHSINTIYSSDLVRARATAAIAARKFAVKVEARSQLREMHFGCWQGLSWKQIARRYQRLANLWVTQFPRQQIPGAEHFDDFAKRVRQELRDLVAANQGRCALVVTHAGVIRVALAMALGMRGQNLFRLALDPCSVNVVDYFQDGFLVRSVNG